MMIKQKIRRQSNGLSLDQKDSYLFSHFPRSNDIGEDFEHLSQLNLSIYFHQKCLLRFTNPSMFWNRFVETLHWIIFNEYLIEYEKLLAMPMGLLLENGFVDMHH